MTGFHRALAIGVLSTALLSTSSRAEDKDDKEGKGPCASDVEKLCKGVKPGGGRILLCLKKQSDQVSDACKEELAEKRRTRGQRAR